MEEEGKKDDPPSTSKELKQDNGQRNDKDDRSVSDYTGSSVATSRSEVMTAAENKRDAKKPPKLVRRKKDDRNRKKDKVKRGRVTKRKRSEARRHLHSYNFTREPRKKLRGINTSRARKNDSVSSIVSRMSRCPSDMSCCQYCGHRCCGRRFPRRCKSCDRRLVRKIVRLIGEARRKRRRALEKIRETKSHSKQTRSSIRTTASGWNVVMSECAQIGSRCNMLSPLYIKSNAEEPVNENLTAEAESYVEVSPEMIYEVLRKLTKWKQWVTESAIRLDLQLNYPVNSNQNELETELADKLRVAAIVGIAEEVVTASGASVWCLHCDLQRSKLTTNHVTLFWQTYVDTMKPFHRKRLCLAK